MGVSAGSAGVPAAVAAVVLMNWKVGPGLGLRADCGSRGRFQRLSVFAEGPFCEFGVEEQLGYL